MATSIDEKGIGGPLELAAARRRENDRPVLKRALDVIRSALTRADGDRLHPGRFSDNV